MRVCGVILAAAAVAFGQHGLDDREVDDQGTQTESLLSDTHQEELLHPLFSRLLKRVGRKNPKYCYTREKWSEKKKKWCCKNMNIGCPCPSVEDICAGKKQCRRECPCPRCKPPCPSVEDICAGKEKCRAGCPCPGCEPPHDCRTKEKWTRDKRRWCCKNEGLGCRGCRNEVCPADICHDGKGRRKIGKDCCACPCDNAFCTKDLCSDGQGRRPIGDNCCACPKPRRPQ